jgi:mRNA interferase RelE/StbE
MGSRRYDVILATSARRALASLAIAAQRRIVRSLHALEADQKPRGAAVLAGGQDQRVWRIRVGDYRVLYEIRNDQLVVLVIRIGHRREVYRDRRSGE